MYRLRSFLLKLRTTYVQFSRRRKIAVFVVLALVLMSVYRSSKPEPVEVVAVMQHRLEKTVFATGNVVSVTDVDLAFDQGGTVSRILVKEGETVSAGQPIIELDQRELASSLAQAEADLVEARASQNQSSVSNKSQYELAVIAVDTAKSSLKDTIATYTTSVENARKTLLTSNLESVPEDGEATMSAPVITGTYFGETEGEYYIDVYASKESSGASFRITGIETASAGVVTTNNPSALGTKGLFVQFPQNFTVSESWVVSIPNKRSPLYIANLSAYTEAVKAKEEAVKAKEDILRQKETELLVAQSENGQTAEITMTARVRRAESVVAERRARLAGAVLLAPASGTVTSVVPVVGESVNAFSQVVRLENVEALQIEAEFNEKDIINVALGQLVKVAFDAFEDKEYTAKVVSISPTATIKEGVVRYKVTAQLDSAVPLLRPGMTANLTIIVGEAPSALTLPSRAIIDTPQGVGVYIKRGTYRKPTWVPVIRGFVGDGGITEVIGELTQGQEVEVPIKQSE